jgi:hypothetical protein
MIRNFNDGFSQLNSANGRDIISIITSISINSPISLPNKPIIVESCYISTKSSFIIKDGGKIICSFTPSFPNIFKNLKISILTSSGLLYNFFFL